jgi:hypothetical protein
MLGKAPAICALLLAAIGAGCSQKEQVRSEIRQGASYAAEAETFLDFVLQGRATARYAHGQAAYLEEAAEESAGKLEPTSPEAAAALKRLARELSGVSAVIGDRGALTAARRRIVPIREMLASAGSEP